MLYAFHFLLLQEVVNREAVKLSHCDLEQIFYLSSARTVTENDHACLYWMCEKQQKNFYKNGGSLR